MIADPGGEHAARDQRVRQAGAELDAGDPVGQQRLDERPGRAEVLHPPAPSGRRPPGRVAEHRGGRVGWWQQRDRVADRHLDAQVGAGQDRGHLVRLDSGDLQAGVQEREGIRADPAAEVDNPGHAGVREPLRPPGRHRRAGGLLQAVGGEEQSLGPLAEFGPGPAPQRNLGGHGGRPFRRQPATQPFRGRQRLRVGLGGRPGEFLRRLRAHQPTGICGVHTGVLPDRRRPVEATWGAPRPPLDGIALHRIQP